MNEKMSNVADIKDPFPKVFEKQLKFYNRRISPEELYGFLESKAKEFPGSVVEFKAIPELLPVDNTKETEKALIVSHENDVLKTVFIMFRVVNFGSSTMIGIYKLSSYREPEKRYVPKQVKQCFRTVTKYDSEYDGKWITGIKVSDIFNGVLIKNRFHDAADLTTGPSFRQKLVRVPKCMGTEEHVETEQYIGSDPVVNFTITREELFHAFFYFYEGVVWKSVQEYIESNQ